VLKVPHHLKIRPI